MTTFLCFLTWSGPGQSFGVVDRAIPTRRPIPTLSAVILVAVKIPRLYNRRHLKALIFDFYSLSYEQLDVNQGKDWVSWDNFLAGNVS